MINPTGQKGSKGLILHKSGIGVGVGDIPAVGGDTSEVGAGVGVGTISGVVPTEPLIMALLLEQHKMINWLRDKISIRRRRFFKGRRTC